MNTPGGKLSLAELDEAPAVVLDPQVFVHNLAALALELPRLATALATLELPETWRPVAGLDGWPTWRLENPKDVPIWLSGSAAPQTRATAILQQARLGDANILLPGLGSGAELSLALKSISGRQAVFVFEPDLAALAAVLRTVSFDAALRQRRCLILEPPDCSTRLRALLDRHAGLLPPTVLLLVPGISQQRMAELRDVCERVALDVTRDRQARLERLQSTPHTRPEPNSPNRSLAIFAPAACTSSIAAADVLHQAAEQADWRALRCIADNPLAVGALFHTQQIAAAPPALIIGVDCGRAALPLAAPSKWAQWHTRKPQAVQSADMHLPDCPARRTELLAAGIPASGLLDFFWAVAPALAPPADPTGPVLFVEELPDLAAAACGITQATHTTLWEGVLHALRAEVAAGRSLAAEGLLIAGERRSGVQLRDESLRGAFVEIINSRGLPGIVLETAAQALVAVAVACRAVGIGWDRLQLSPPGELPPSAVVVTSLHDVWTPVLAALVGNGLPLLVLECAPGQSAAKLTGILQAGKHYENIRMIADLPRAVESLRRDAAAYHRRVERLRTHLAEHHQWRSRFEMLAARLLPPA